MPKSKIKNVYKMNEYKIKANIFYIFGINSILNYKK